jgi:hypothetical protein
MLQHIQKLRVICTIASALAIAEIVAAPLQAIGDDNVIESFKISGNGDVLLIPVQIGTQRCKFILDTGAVTNVFDTSLEGVLETTKYVTMRASKEYPLYRSPTASVGDSALPLEGLAVCQDLSQMRKLSGWDFRGIVGTQFLQKYVIQVDFDGGRLSFLRSAKDVGRERIRFVPDPYGRPSVNVGLAGAAATPFLVDTGNCEFTNGTLTSSTVDALVKADAISIAAKRAVALGPNGFETGRHGTVDYVLFAGHRHDQQPFNEGNVNALGLGYLSRFLVTFDFPGGAMYVEKANGFNKSFPDDENGLQIAIRNGVVEISDAATDGLGFRSGIRRGDQILKVNGESPLQFSHRDLFVKLNHSSEGVRLKFRRPGDDSVREVFIKRSTAQIANSDSSPQ